MPTLALHTAIALALTGAPPVAEAPQPQAIAAIAACRGVADASARLACFDKAAQQLQSALSDRNVVVIDREEVRRTRRSLFGISLPEVGFLKGKGEDAREVEAITATIREVTATGDRYVFTLDTGARWQTLEDSSRQLTPRSGQSVTIRKGVLGSYRLSVANRPALRAMRLP